MSYADVLFKKTCRDILENGTDTSGEEVRPHWEDGTPAYTIKTFGVANLYDLRKEFPALTLRNQYIKSSVDELLWITQRKSNDTHDLKSGVWDKWTDENGTIGKAYGYQVGSKFIFASYSSKDKANKVLEECRNFFGEGEGLPSARISFNETTGNYDFWLDQMDSVLWQLRKTPYSRRIMLNYWNFNDLHEMGLQPCAYNIVFNVEKDKDGNLVLNAQLNQRSQDMLAANGWNVGQYSILLMMIAQVSNMIPGKLLHAITDCHIYDRHIPMIKELLDREEFKAPKVYLKPEVKNFYNFTSDDIIIEDYQYGPQIKGIPIAV